MFSIERQVAHDRARNFRTTAGYLEASSAPDDRAHAELHRIAARAWEAIEHDLISYRSVCLAGDVAGLPEIDDSKYPLMIKYAWKTFCGDFILAPSVAAEGPAPVSMAGLVRRDGSPSPEPQAPARRQLAPELRGYVRPRADELVIADMCATLRIPVPADDRPGPAAEPEPEDEAVRRGLHRATPEGIEAARRRPKTDWSHRRHGPADRAADPGTPASPAGASPPDPTRPTRARATAAAK